MTAEGDVLTLLLNEVDRSVEGLDVSLQYLRNFPEDVAAFEAMAPLTKLISSAMIKQFEQLEDALARLFRTVLKVMGISVKGLYPTDIANRMAELDVLDDPAAWVVLVKLRNELVHEYPFDAQSRFERVSQAYAGIPMLSDAARRIRIVVESKGLLK